MSRHPDYAFVVRRLCRNYLIIVLELLAATSFVIIGLLRRESYFYFAAAAALVIVSVRICHIFTLRSLLHSLDEGWDK